MLNSTSLCIFFKTMFYWRQEKVTLYNDLMSNDTSILERRIVATSTINYWSCKMCICNHMVRENWLVFKYLVLTRWFLTTILTINRTKPSNVYERLVRCSSNLLASSIHYFYFVNFLPNFALFSKESYTFLDDFASPRRHMLELFFEMELSEWNSLCLRPKALAVSSGLHTS